MARIYVTLDDELEQTFRKEVGRRKGSRKGSMGEAVSEAIRLWLSVSEKGE